MSFAPLSGPLWGPVSEPLSEPLSRHLRAPLLARLLAPLRSHLCALLSALVLALALLSTGPARAAPSPAPPTQATQPTPIDVDRRGAIPLWSAVTLLHDPGGAWTLDDVLAMRQRFVPHAGTPSNLGRTTDTVWLRIPLRVAGSTGTARVLEIDYPPLNHVEVVLLQGGVVLSQATLGNALDFAQRPMPSRTHAAPLALPPGDSELLVRVRSSSSLVLPMTLRTHFDFNAYESLTQLLNGALAGLAMCMLIYSLVHGISLREPMFLSYALMLAANCVFFLSYFGIGQQYVWPHWPQVSLHIAPLAALLATVGGCGFVRLALQMEAVSRGSARAVQVLGWLAGLGLIAGLLGLLDYRATQNLASVVGPLAALVALPVALLRAWRGERIAVYLVVGWASYTAGAVSLSGLLRGYFEPTSLARHLYPVGTVLEMAAWMMVLAMRVQTIHRNADRTRIETEALRALAHTDALTGLPNRRGLQQHLSLALQRSHPQQLLAVFLLDLDGFKPINDLYGHDVGDALLVAVARRLQAELRGSDVVARLGGDEFVVLASGLLDTGAAHALGHKLLGAFEQPFDAAGRHCRVGLTVGYAIAAIDGDSAEALLKSADAAMYAGKAAGRGRLERAAPRSAAGADASPAPMETVHGPLADPHAGAGAA